MRVVTAKQMRELDRRTIEDLRIPGIVLMEHAGRTVAAAIEDQLDHGHHHGSILVCAYRGNNGGDGFVVARLLAQAGYEVELALLCDPDELAHDAASNYDFLTAFPVEVYEYDTEDPDWLEEFAFQVSRAGVIVDALLGTGIEGAVRPPLDGAISVINEYGSRLDVLVVAVDLPSGLNADRGTYENVVVRADLTVTMGLPKLGLISYPGRELAGELVVADICIPQAFVSALEPQWELLDYGFVGSLLPPRPAEGHKGTFGRAYLIAGSPGFTGAATLAGTAALRAGTGLVTVGTPRGVHPTLEEKLTEVMTEALAEDTDGRVTSDALPAVRKRLQESDAVAIGPGLGRGPEVTELVAATLREAAAAGVPVVVDADGLNALADLGDPPAGLDAVSRSGATAILTPHPGELGRLVGATPSDVQADRVGYATRAANKSDAVVVLKGAGTIVAEPGGRLAFNMTGNSGLASGGTGDVLTGVIVGLVAQGLPPFEAACVGVFVHGLGGDLAAEEVGERSLSAGDVINQLSSAFKKVEE